VRWKWDDFGRPILSSIAETPAALRLTCGTSPVETTITRKEATSALRTLGTWTSPSGNQTKQFQAIKQVMTDIVTHIKSTPLSQLQARLLTPLYLHAKLRCVFAATAFTRDECLRVDRLFLGTILSKMGMCCTTSRKIIHASPKFGGYDLPSSWDLQGSLHIHLFIGHIQLGDLVGKFLLQCCDRLYLLIGKQAPLFMYNFDTIRKHAPETWITNTWDYTSGLKATLTCPALVLPPQREHDVAIMDRAIDAYTGQKLSGINSVRLYLHVFFLSDITDSSGQYIDENYLKPDKPRTRTALLSSPNQPCPGPRAWQVWRSFIWKHFTRSVGTFHTPKLRQTLGRWLSPSITTQQWPDLIDPHTLINSSHYSRP